MQRLTLITLAAALCLCAPAAGVINAVTLTDTITSNSQQVIVLENGSSVLCPSAEPASSLCGLMPVDTDITFYSEYPSPDTDAAALGAYQAIGFSVDDGSGAAFNDSWVLEGCVSNIAPAVGGGDFITLSLQQATVTTFCADAGPLGSLCDLLAVGHCATFAGEVPDATSDLFGFALIMRSALLGDINASIFVDGFESGDSDAWN